MAPTPESVDPSTTREQLTRTKSQIDLLQAAVEATMQAESCSHCGALPNPALLREAANLARAAATVSAEVRQLDKHERELDDKLTPDGVLAMVRDYLVELDPDRRASLRQFLSEIDDEGGLLAG